MNHDENQSKKAHRVGTRRRPRSRTYTRTVINLTTDEERKLGVIATSIGMEGKAGEGKPSKAMVIAELIDRGAQWALRGRW